MSSELSSINIEKNAENGFSKIKYIQVYNFMSLEDAKIEFDERNIINLKGFNDSGKSCMLRACDVLMYNRYSTSHTKFIQDEKDYFRIIMAFDDGVTIVRDKYSTGAGLYEMYKDSECIFSTKQNGVFTKITGVPEPIEKYLGVVRSDGIFLNSRNCYEKQLLTDTTGKENYNFLNVVLRSNEISRAGALLNVDKNRVYADKCRLESEVEVLQDYVKAAKGVSRSLVESMKEHDRKIDLLDSEASMIEKAKEILNYISAVPNIPELSKVDSYQVDLLDSIRNVANRINGIVVAPELGYIEDDGRLDLLERASLMIKQRDGIVEYPELRELGGVEQLEILDRVKDIKRELDSVEITPELKSCNSEELSFLAEIMTLRDSIKRVEGEISNSDSAIRGYSDELHELQSKIQQLGVRVVKCKNCGSMIDLDDEAVHVH